MVICYSINRQLLLAKKGLTELVEVIAPDIKREIEVLLYNGGKKEYIWNQRFFEASLSTYTQC